MGPIVRGVSELVQHHSPWDRTSVLSREGWRQSPPYDIPLPYSRHASWAVSAVCTPGHHQLCNVNAPWGDHNQSVMRQLYPDDPELDLFRNRLRGKMQALVNDVDTAELMADYGERHSAYSSLQARLEQLLVAAKAIRRLRFRGAFDALTGTTLRLQGPRVVPSVSKDRLRRGGGVVLEWNFGWAPLINDIDNAIKVLARDFVFMPHIVRSGDNLDLSSFISYAPVAGFTANQTVKSFTKLRGAYELETRLVEPNILLLSQLGFANPISVAWELIPYSFLIDYVFNVGQFIGHISDFYGLDVKNEQWNFKAATDRSFLHDESRDWDQEMVRYVNLVSKTMTFQRVIGRPGVTLGLKANWRNPFADQKLRAANTIALLLTFLR